MKAIVVGMMVLTVAIGSISAVAARSRTWIPPLTKEDLVLVKEAGRDKMQGMSEGTTNKWSNPKSGNRGIVILRRVFAQDNLNCQENEHLLQIAGEQSARRYTVTICKYPDGTWKIH
jgi:surface antigen